jgi:hypothetical protein
MPQMTLTRRTRASLASLAIVATAHLTVHAQTNKPPAPSASIEKYSATTVNLNPGSGEPLSIRISRWSTDMEREHLATLLTEKGPGGDEEMQYPLEVAPTVGYIWTNETLGYAVRYAYRMALPDGGERIIVATDHKLGEWSKYWEAPSATVPNYLYTLIELRLNRRGIGEGKMSLGAKVVVEQETKTIALENYAAAPVLLKDVKRDGPRGVQSVAPSNTGRK